MGSVTGGGFNTARGGAFYYASVTGGYNNTASGLYSSVTGGNSNTASTEYSSVSGSEIFDCVGDTCTAQEKIFTFPKSLVIGAKNKNCIYGNATLSVDFGKSGQGKNCPEGKGSVAFGFKNTASGDFSAVLGGGGASNVAESKHSAVTGGQKNLASGIYSAIMAGKKNEAAGKFSSVTGGLSNKPTDLYGEVCPC